MKASVVIPACNGHDNVLRAVRSLKNQVESEGGVEVIVIDDGSRPPLVGSLKSEIDDKRYRVVRHERVLGRSAARNAGIKESRGDIIIFMDSDMTAHPGFIRAHLAVHEGSDRVACVGRVVWTGLSSLHRYLESRGVKKVKDSRAVPWRYLDSSNFSCERNALDRAGAFYEGIRQWGGEDTLMGYELHHEGVEIRYEKEAITYHHSAVDIDEVCRKNYTFGRHSLPVMIGVRPELSRWMRVHYLTAPSRDEGPFFRRWGARLLVRSLLRFPGQRAVRILLDYTGEGLSFLCYDYLVYSSILRGYGDFLREEGNAGEADPAGRGGKPEGETSNTAGVES